MALSTIIHQKCPECGKVAVEKSKTAFGNSVLVTLECGHLIEETELKSSYGNDLITSFDKKIKLMSYQSESVRFAERASARVLFAHEQGLGKTIIATALINLHKAELLPAVIVVPTTVKVQWFWEIARMTGHPIKDKGLFCQVLNGGKEVPLPGMQIYITTYDLLKTVSFDGINVKTVIIDECQRIKNHLSDRAKAVQNLTRNVEHILALSGTPIKNNAGEYFTILNILQPRKFPTYQGYLDKYCDSYWGGYGVKVGGLKNPEQFRLDTEDFIIRKTKAEVMPDLPPMQRKFYHVELDGKLRKVYNECMAELEDALYDDDIGEMERQQNMLAIMAKMRKATGISKAYEAADFVAEHLESTDRKLVVFLHHQDAHTLLDHNLKAYCAENGVEPPLNLTSALNGDARAEMVKKFREDSRQRLMIASTLAAGEGLNLQFCSDAVMMERQWNPANEEQAEARFHRFGQKNPVSITYMLCSGTIDEYFTDLVEQKRAIFVSTMDNQQIAWDQNSLVKELAAVLVAKGRDRFRL